MMLKKNVGLFLLFFIVTEVTPWTVDLVEVRKHLFSKEDKVVKNEYKEYIHSDSPYYSNVQGNSMHNSEEKKYDKYKKKDDFRDHSHERDGSAELQGSYERDNKYADEFGYQSYMEKKVQDIVHDGGVYLEGLRRSLEAYSKFLEDCNRRNMTFQNATFTNFTLMSPLNPTNFTMTFNTTTMRFQNMTGNMTMMQPGANFTQFDSNRNRSSIRMSCREATEATEKVRRYADLAMWATRRLQDLAYAEKYQKTDKYEENELILKLAWFLDKLAVLTGYQPNYIDYLPQITTAAPTTPPTAMTLVPQNEDLVNLLINCVKTNSSIPATIRCRYPLPLPDMAQQILRDTSTVSPQDSAVSPTQPTPPDSQPQQSMELLITADDYRSPHIITKRSPHHEEYYVPIEIHEKEKPKPIVEFIVKKLTNLKSIVKNVKKHAVADFASQIAHHKHFHKRSIDDNSVLLNKLTNNLKMITKKPITDLPIYLPVLDVSVVNTKSFKKRSIDSNIKISKSNLDVKKRSVDDPLTHLAKYYVKHKVWTFANPLKEKNYKKSNFDVSNHLDTKNNKNISKRSIFHKKHRFFKLFKPLNLKYKKHSQLGKGKISKYINSIYEKKNKSKKNRHRVFKRSLLYEHMYLPRIPANPVGDISYYVKNKEGRNYNPSLYQAARVRTGLQQHFATGNIEVIHRYGSNYNPAIPAPFYAGVIKTMADA